MFNLFKKRQKIKPNFEKDRHKPSIILPSKNISKDKGFKRNQIKPRGDRNFKGILFGVLGLALLLGLVFLVNHFFTTSDLKFEKITVLGNKTISETDLKQIIKPFTGKNMILLNIEEISVSIKKAFPIIQGLQISKLYPNKIFIKINEREPKVVYLSLNSAYVADTEGRILNILSTQKIDFPEEKILIARGLGDYNSQILKDYFLNEFIVQSKLSEKTEEERTKLIAEGYSFEKITEDQKRIVLKKLAADYNLQIEEFFAKNSGIVLGSKYRELPEVYVLGNTEVKQDDNINLTKQNLTIELINRLEVSKMEYTQIKWEGEILVKVILKDKKQLVFSNRRSLSEQWEDYQLVLGDLIRRGKGYSVIDLSSTKISVIN